MNVAVCDDDAGTRRQMQGYLEQYEKEQGTELALYFYDSGEAFLEAYPMKIDVLFRVLPKGEQRPWYERSILWQL